MTVKKSDGSTKHINDTYYLEWFNNNVYLVKKDKRSNYNSYIDNKDDDDFKEAIKEYDKEKSRKTLFESGVTPRGFKTLEFKDLRNDESNIQESSIATDCGLWIGLHTGRMHINQDMAEQIATVLLYFSKHGKLPSYFFKEE